MNFICCYCMDLLQQVYGFYWCHFIDDIMNHCCYFCIEWILLLSYLWILLLQLILLNFIDWCCNCCYLHLLHIELLLLLLSAANSYVTTNCLLLLDTDAWYFILYWILWYMTVTDSNELLYSPMMISSVMFWCLLTWFKRTSSLIRSYIPDTQNWSISSIQALRSMIVDEDLKSGLICFGGFLSFIAIIFVPLYRPENFLFVCRGVWCILYGHKS